MATSFTYAQLKAALEEWTEENDTDFTANVDLILNMGEDRCLRELDLSIFDTTSENIVSTVNGTATVAKPSGFLVARDLWYYVAGERVFLERRTRSYMMDYAPNPTTTGAPLYFDDGYNSADILLAPTPGAIYVMGANYVKRPDALSGSHTTTWLSMNAGDLLFHSCVLEAIKFIQQFADLEIWQAHYDRALAAARHEFRDLIRKDFTLAPIPAPKENA